MNKKCTIYHPNAKGTGSALSLEVIPSTGQNDGGLMLSFSRQTAIAERGEDIRTYPKFGYSDAISILLKPVEVAEILRTFEGEKEAVGLYAEKGGLQVLQVRHVFDPDPAFALELTRYGDEREDERVITLTQAERSMLYHGLSACMGEMMFGK